MSLAVQSALRDLTLSSYFQSIERFQTLDPAFVLLAWASMPGINDKGKVFWDWPDVTVRRQHLDSVETRSNLTAELRTISARLNENPGTRQFYTPDQAGKILANVKTKDPRLEGLLFAEAVIIDAAGAAYDAMAKIDFGQKPSKAIEQLAEFGSKLTEAFNSDVTNIYLGGVSRALGTIVYLAATKALAGSTDDVTPDAMLTITALKADAPLDAETFLNSGTIEAKSIAAQEILTAIA
jgi:hypothetical protein